MMYELNNKKPESTKRQTDDTVAHALITFAQSLAYSGVEAPVRGAVQIVDHAFGTSIDDKVQSKFDQVGVHPPETAQFGSLAWDAQQLGNAIGMTVPMWLARKTIVGKTEQAFAKTAATEERLVAGLQQTGIANNAIREAKLSATTGFVFGAALTPTDGKDSSDNFWTNRVKQGLNGFTTFGAMGYSSSLSSSLLGRAADSLESTSLQAAFKSPMKAALRSSLVQGAIGGVPGGIVQAQLSAMESGKPLATLQDIKENVVSMSMVGGVMGSVGLFQEKQLRPEKNNNEINPPLNDKDLPTPPIPESQPSRFVKAAHPFDIKFDPIKKAWTPEEVNKHMSVESSSIEFIPANRDSAVGREDWNKFENWGTERREVPVNVYRFPGLKAEIVVPSDYAHILDQIRLQRLNPSSFAAEEAANEGIIRSRIKRVLPEEIAQILKQLPQSDVVKRVELLDHARPQDLLWNHELKLKAKAKGEVIDEVESPWFSSNPVAIADAAFHEGTIRLFDSMHNGEHMMQRVTAHEWAHLLEDSNAAYKAFPVAAYFERNGYFSYEYATTNTQENWAVHFEVFLQSDGRFFAELPEKAPARALVIAKALRNMLEERMENPSPKHQEFFARTQAAEDIAAGRLQESILADIKRNDQTALAATLFFLNTAALDAHSPDLLARVIRQIEPALEASEPDNMVVSETLAVMQAIQLAENYSSEQMRSFSERWKKIGSLDAYVTTTRLFKLLPEAGQRELMQGLIENPFPRERYVLSRLYEATEGQEKQLVQNTMNIAQQKFTQEGLRLYRINEHIPNEYCDWLKNSDEPEARLAALKNESRLATAHSFTRLIEGLSPSAIRELIAADAMAYVASNNKSETWSTVLKSLPQKEQVKLFDELGQKQDPSYKALALKIGEMNGTEFDANFQKIQDESISILLRRENTLEFIKGNPLRIKDVFSFTHAVQSLDSSQIADLIKDWVLKSSNDYHELDLNNVLRFCPENLLNAINLVSQEQYSHLENAPNGLKYYLTWQNIAIPLYWEK